MSLFKKSISRRWFVNTIGVVTLILVAFIVILSFIIQSYYYNSIQQSLKGRLDELLNVLYDPSSESIFTSKARDYAENFKDKNSIEIMVINNKGNILVTSTGFAPDTSQDMPDYYDSLSGSESIGYWTGDLNTGEKAMAITKTVKDTNDNVIGSIRYIVSMEKVDKQIKLIIIALVIISFLIMIFLFSTGLYFVRSIVVPVREVSATARQISRGDFDIRLEKKKDDELGELCDSVNDMANELKASEQMKNDFISSISHELRTPLTSIKGWAETLNDYVDNDISQRGISIIVNESERLTSLVEELLDFSRIQNGSLKLNIKEVALFSELDEVVYMFTNRARSEDKEIIYKENTQLLPIAADSSRLRQVFINIIDNALKYTDSGGSITISSYEQSGVNNVVITDTGCGIPREHLPNIKKRFYKANQNVRGSGIGLAVADEIITLHGGSLEIDSQEGIGTSVKILLPSIKMLSENIESIEGADLKNYFERTLNTHE